MTLAAGPGTGTNAVAGRPLRLGGSKPSSPTPIGDPPSEGGIRRLPPLGSGLRRRDGGKAALTARAGALPFDILLYTGRARQAGLTNRLPG